MRETTTKVYTFDELNDKAKEKARDWYREGWIFEWWDSVYEDAKNIGLQIRGFDIDRGSYVKGRFLASAEKTAHKIEEAHGGDTLKTAKAYLKERDEIINTAEKDENGDFKDEYALDQKLEELDKEFLKSLCEDYLVVLRREWEYITSDELVDDNIVASGYEFTEEGKRA